MTAACYSTEIACGQKVPSSTHFSRTPSGVVALQSPDTEPWKTDAAAELASGFFNFLVPILVWGLIGLMIAVLTRKLWHRNRCWDRLASRGGEPHWDHGS